MEEFEELIGGIEGYVQKLLEEHNYNTVGNFIAFYEGFKRSECSSLVEHFQSYYPQITSKHHTCVGLALELWKKLYRLEETAYPYLTAHLYLVSCEESIGTFDDYPGLYDNIHQLGAMLEKEHVLLAMKFQLAGRFGIMLCDPGYHVGRVIVVMQDNLYPHTGWFVQSRESNVLKEYNYNFSTRNANFIEWYDRTQRNNAKMEEIHSLIHIKRPYLTGIDVTERRNLVYTFRSLLSRDQKGHLIAGVYFKVKRNYDEFTVFYQDAEKKQRIKLNFADFQHVERVNDNVRQIIDKCNMQLNMENGELMHILHSLAEIINNQSFITQLLGINNWINNMTEVD